MAFKMRNSCYDFAPLWEELKRLSLKQFKEGGYVDTLAESSLFMLFQNANSSKIFVFSKKNTLKYTLKLFDSCIDL